MMKVAILSYPMLFQRTGGLQIQILETIKGLKRLGIDATLIDPNRHKIDQFDLVHIFACINGNHRIVETAKAHDVPVVISSLIRKDWTVWQGVKGRTLSKLVRKLSNWSIITSYDHIKYCLDTSDRIIALGEFEKVAIASAFRVNSDKIDVIPNGIPDRFFNRNEQDFRRKTNISSGFVLCVGAISPRKNQLTIAQALKDSALDLVLIGECLKDQQNYLEQLNKFNNVHYLGKLHYDDPLLISAYSSAGVFCLPSQDEVMPLSVLESLAAGTPVVMTRNHCMDMVGMERIVVEVDPQDIGGIRAAILNLISKHIVPMDCQKLVRRYTWDKVAEDIALCYKRALLKIQ